MGLGGGARGAGEAAPALGLPIVTTVNGKGVADERHPLSLGASSRLRCVRRWLETRDCALAVGTELGESDLWGPMPALRNVIRVDIDPSQLDKNVVATRGIVGDAREVLEALARERGEGRGEGDDRPGGEDGGSGGEDGGEDVTDLTAIRTQIDEEARRDGAHWIPLMEVLDDVLGEDGILATAAQVRLPLPVLVPSNRGYGEIRDHMVEQGIEPVGADLDAPDLPRLAEALGGTGLRATDATQVRDALEQALTRPGPTLIEVPDPGSARS